MPHSGATNDVVSSLPEEERSNIPSIYHAMWLAIVTMTTVGYGDYFPTSLAPNLDGEMVAGHELQPLMGLVHVPVSHLVCGFLSQTGYIVASLLTFSSVLFLALPVLLKNRIRRCMVKWGYSAKDLRMLIEYVDVDGDGVLALTEFLELMRQMRIGITAQSSLGGEALRAASPESSAIDLFMAFDDDANGYIDYDEFLRQIFPEEYVKDAHSCRFLPETVDEQILNAYGPQASPESLSPPVTSDDFSPHSRSQTGAVADSLRRSGRRINAPNTMPQATADGMKWMASQKLDLEGAPTLRGGQGKPLELSDFEAALPLILQREGFSTKEYEEFQLLFTMNDRDGSGDMDRRVNRIDRRVDRDGSGSLNFVEWLSLHSVVGHGVTGLLSKRLIHATHHLANPKSGAMNPTIAFCSHAASPSTAKAQALRRRPRCVRRGGREVADQKLLGLSDEAEEKLKKLRRLDASPRLQAAAIAELFPFELDEAQKEAARQVAEGKDVLCCLPTGSGKTAIAIAAAWQALLQGARMIYTSPLKALSAQKRRQLSDIFGAEAVGLVTGDHCIIPDAPIVVMTTEILRNKLYMFGNSLGERGQHLVVVLDELHWISDRSRGSVWEEVIINGPSSCQFLGLSGSVGGDPQEFCHWMESILGRPCGLVVSQRRPVPLNFYVMRRSKSSQNERSFPLWDEAGTELHPRLLDEDWRDVPEKPKGPGLPRVLALARTLKRLQRLKWLPALSFSLQRRRCEEKVQDAHLLLSLARPGAFRSPAFRLLRWRPLVTEAEAAEIQQALTHFERDFPDLELSQTTREVLLNGLAAHHAGLMPAHRALVETLFERGLLKLVFATETLAAGIHMPAKAVLLNSQRKKDAFGLRSLNGTELQQMCGRAGRRGLDLRGHVLVEGQACWTAQTLIDGPLPLSSSFAPSYDMLCALFTGGRLEHSVAALCAGSFAAFLARSETPDVGHAPEAEDIQVLQDYGEELKATRELLEENGSSMEELEEYLKLRSQQQLDLALGNLGHSDDDDVLELDEAPSLLERHRVHQLELREALLEAFHRRNTLLAQLARHQPRKGHQWSSFQRYIAVLEEEGFLCSTVDAGDGRFLESTAKGAAAHGITRGANLLWLSALLPKPLGPDITAGLEPADLAALVAAMTEPREDARSARSARGDLGTSALEEALKWLSDYRWHLWEVQLRHGVCEPLPLSLDAFRLVRRWASTTCAWRPLVDSAGRLGEGDVFRLLRRTMEVLEGLEYCTSVEESWHSRVREARKLLVESGEVLLDGLGAFDGSEPLGQAGCRGPHCGSAKDPSPFGKSNLKHSRRCSGSTLGWEVLRDCALLLTGGNMGKADYT
ncbi:DExH-box ATP-dependent RNA helicase DExH15 chloroplastic (ATP-dependent RNA helicase ISE2) (Protein EMBRYO DEFECTIVE 25) (Protein INCREASED SIZE EXCLUSION LIMIT 2) (Protein PIGMENT DEFECTIVE 317) [Durusdinium trenchii]|uniref:DExH-box ATP-dependent RNA helicase DExH15 chloroplastic (ATP-dependent RNA helicase ISE2) (Protein EMBRYO DEFECTIVE 25) (Protein INCREASED SIZE EXCLUSION LIMIT 2) (Protein PIGMENT DEFECTIVE 317) n=1 Tax=Durusdinium trenchii TaxID=1381693 RepID=A0ABP0KCI1_9DINO